MVNYVQLVIQDKMCRETEFCIQIKFKKSLTIWYKPPIIVYTKCNYEANYIKYKFEFKTGASKSDRELWLRAKAWGSFKS